MTPKQKLPLEYLEGLAEHSLKTPTFFHEHTPQDKVTIKQFCLELASEMTYQYECDVRDKIVTEKGEDVEST